MKYHDDYTLVEHPGDQTLKMMNQCCAKLLGLRTICIQLPASMRNIVIFLHSEGIYEELSHIVFSEDTLFHPTALFLQYTGSVVNESVNINHYLKEYYEMG